MPIASLSQILESTRYDNINISNDTSPNTACMYIFLNLEIVGMYNQVGFLKCCYTCMHLYLLLF